MWEKAFQSHALPWIDGSNLLGWEDPVAEKYAVRGIPHQVLIGRDGKILGIGFHKQGAVRAAGASATAPSTARIYAVLRRNASVSEQLGPESSSRMVE